MTLQLQFQIPWKVGRDWWFHFDSLPGRAGLFYNYSYFGFNFTSKMLCTKQI